MSGGRSAEIAACEEDFLTHHSGWSVPRSCHRPAGHAGEHCGRGGGHEHLRGCTDAITAPTEDAAS